MLRVGWSYFKSGFFPQLQAIDTGCLVILCGRGCAELYQMLGSLLGLQPL